MERLLARAHGGMEFHPRSLLFTQWRVSTVFGAEDFNLYSVAKAIPFRGSVTPHGPLLEHSPAVFSSALFYLTYT